MLFLGLLTRHRVGVALFGQARTIASDLRVAGSRYALGPYTPVDPITWLNHSFPGLFSACNFSGSLQEAQIVPN